MGKGNQNIIVVIFAGLIISLMIDVYISNNANGLVRGVFWLVIAAIGFLTIYLKYWKPQNKETHPFKTINATFKDVGFKK